MIVYGDPAFTAPLDALIDELCAAFAACTQTPALDALRALLIRAGQLEQAVFDAPADLLPGALGDTLRAWCHAATAEAARMFFDELKNQEPRTENQGTKNSGTQHPVIVSPCHRVTLSSCHPVIVKVPEGFAFYALYPDQYCVAAQRWLTEHAEAATRRALVVGVRSIGTTLGAVVAATLAAHGWEMHSFSVRPTGHPFAREVDLGGQTFDAETWALVVDEGPGLSGSSMAAVAAALLDAGVARERIAFFPGHAGEPGSAASDAVREWWRTTPRYVGALLLDGRALPDALAAATETLCDGDPVVRIEDFGGGQWRAAIYTAPALWPAVCAPFERPKYRCTTHSGARVLWKFGGLAIRGQGSGVRGQGSGDQEPVGADQRVRPSTKHQEPAHLFSLSPCHLVTLSPHTPEAHGFVAQRWLDGTPLTRADATPALLAEVGRYIVAVAAVPLAAEEQRAAFARMSEMLYWNVWEALGEAQAARTRWVAEAALDYANVVLPAAGDGRLAPHEWLRLASGEIIKVDQEGSDSDHTVVGRQPVAWDVAGALAEWRLSTANAALLLDAYHAAGGAPLSAALLMFYRLAYAAFKLGQCAMCVEMTSDSDEQTRLRAAVGWYRTDLQTLLTGV